MPRGILVILGSLALLPACRPDRAPAATVEEVLKDDLVADGWIRDLDEAVTLARDQSKPIFLVFR